MKVSRFLKLLLNPDWLEGDVTRVLHTYPSFQLRKQLNQGGTPYYTLHKRVNNWRGREVWGNTDRWSEEKEKLQKYVLRYESFPGDFHDVG